MAARYWVGGTASWDATAGSKWALTSGATGGQAVPTTSDTVFFDANSGASTVTIGAGAICSTLTMTGFTGTLAFGTNSIETTVTGSNTAYTGASTFSVTGTPLIRLTGVGTAGQTRAINPLTTTEANSISFTISAGADNINTGTLQVYKNLTFTSGFTGVLTAQDRVIFGDLTLSSGMTSSSTSGITTLMSTSGSQQLTTNASLVDFNISTGQALTTTAATGNGTTATLTFGAQSVIPFSVGSTVNVINVVPAGYNGTYTVTACTTTTVSYANATTGAQTTAGGVGTTNTVTIQDALTLNTVRTLSHRSGTLDLTNKTVTTGFFTQGVGGVSRTMAFGTTGSLNITGNNTNVMICNGSTPSTLTGNPTVNLIYAGSVGTRAVLTGSNSNLSTHRYNFFVTAGSDTINFQNQVGSLNFTGFSGTWQNQPLGITGSLTLSTGMTVGSGANAVSFHNWGGTQQVASATKNLDFPITYGFGINTTGASGDGTTATLTFSNSFQSPTIGSTIVVAGVVPAGYNGTYTVTASTLTSVSYTNATTGVQTGAGVIWTSSTIRLVDNLSVGTATSRTIALSGATLDLNDKTLTNFGIFSSSTSAPRSIAFGTTGAYTNTYDNAAGGTVWGMATATNFSITGTSTINITGNSTAGIRTLQYGNTVQPPSPEANSLSIYITAGSDTVTLTGTFYFRNLDFTGSFTGILSTNTRIIYGNLKYNANMTVTGGSNITTFAATSGTQQITSAGKNPDCPITFSGTAIYRLLDPLSVGVASNRTVTLTSGTLDLNNNDFTIRGEFNSDNSNTRTIAFGTGQFYLSAISGNVWFVRGTNLTITGTSPTVNATGASGDRTIVHVPTTVSQALAINLNVTAGDSSSTFGFGSGNQLVNNLNFTGFSGRIGNAGLSAAGRFNVYGNITMGAGMITVGAVSEIAWQLLGTGTQLITSNGVAFSSPFSLSGTGTYSLQDAFVTGATRQIAFNSGTLLTNGYNMTCGNFTYNNGNTKAFNLGTSTITILGGTSTSGWEGSNAGTTYTSVTSSTIVFTTTGNCVFSGGQGGGIGNQFGTIRMAGLGGTLNLGNGSTVTRCVTLENTVSPCTITNGCTTGFTVTNFNVSGTAGNLVTLNSNTAGTRRTINQSSGTVNAQYLSIQDSAASGGATWNAVNSTNISNNTGWNFLTTNSGNFFMMF